MLCGIPAAEFGLMLGPQARLAGIDEAGRGPLAGPVVAAAVVLCKPCPVGLADSKRLSPARRARAEQAIRASCAFGIGVVEPAQIDQLNILAATMLAMTQAMERLSTALGAALSTGWGTGLGADEGERAELQPGLTALVDGNLTPQGRCEGWRWPARAIVGGDASEPAISAASIIAKEYRDRIMREAARHHPEYGWERNKGYGTREHLAALQAHGPTPLHRRSFAPVAQTLLAL